MQNKDSGSNEKKAKPIDVNWTVIHLFEYQSVNLASDRCVYLL